jgi:hypothetical protein
VFVVVVVVDVDVVVVVGIGGLCVRVQCHDDDDDLNNTHRKDAALFFAMIITNFCEPQFPFK